MADEGFHEIQLNGKQLVFLFMAGTVVCVVIFLLGVTVGRGVQVPAAALAASAGTPIDPTASVQPSSARVGRAPDDGMPLSAQETLTYAERLEEPVPPPGALREPAMTTAAAVPEPVSEPVSEPPDEQPAAAPAAGDAFPDPGGDGFVVQVGAYDRATADLIARQLASKGFPTFITPRGGLFAVRVGKYDDRREAEAVGRRLEQDEQFKEPWLTR
jgi:cell division protein FtsN